MQTDRRRSTQSTRRLLVVLLALTCAFLSVLIALPVGSAGAQAPNDLIAFDRNAEIILVNSDGSAPVSRGKGFGPSFSPDGTQIAFAFPDTVETRLIYKMLTDGTNRLPLTDSFQEISPAWSPDGSTIAFVSEREDPEYIPGDDLYSTPRLYLMDSNGGGEHKVMARSQSRTESHIIEQEMAPAWSPDGLQLAFIGHSRTTSGASRTNVYVVNRDGTGLREVTHLENGSLGDVDRISWSKDGTKIAFQMSRDIHVVNPDGQSAPINLTNTINRDEGDPAFSPEGGRIAYAANDFNDNTKDGLYIMKANGQDQVQIVSSTGSGQQISRPAWHPLATDPTEEPSPPPSPSPEADMSIGLTALPVQPKVGDNVTYTLVVKNNGPDNAAESFANFQRSQNLDLVTVTPAQGVCQPSVSDPLGTVCSTGPLASGASTTVTIVVRPTAPGESGISGTVGAPPIDNDTNNNSKTVNVTAVPAPTPPCTPEVTTEIAGSIWRPGSQTSRNVRHVITVRNDSGRTLNGLVHFVFDGLDQSISDGDPRETFFNTRCAQPLGRPFKSIGVADLVWHPGQVIQLEVQFFNPERVNVNYNLRIYTGPGFP